MTPRETAQSYDALASHWAGEEGELRLFKHDQFPEKHVYLIVQKG